MRERSVRSIVSLELLEISAKMLAVLRVVEGFGGTENKPHGPCALKLVNLSKVYQARTAKVVGNQIAHVPVQTASIESGIFFTFGKPTTVVHRH